MRAWSRAGVCSPNPPTLCPDTSCCRSILPIPNTCCSGRWEGWSVGGNSGICQASISCSPWTRRRRKRFPQDCSVPVVNLFERLAEPIRVDHERSGHLLVPDLRHRDSTEVHSVIAVDALEGGKRSSVMPYFSLSGEGDAPPSLMWFLRRKPSLDGIGTDVFLHFKEAAFRPETARPWVASARVLCTNRHRAAERWRQGELTRDTDMPTAAIRFCGPPSQQHDPPMFGGELWKLVSHLSLHQLSLSGPDADNVLRELLRLYAPPRDAFAQRQIAGVNGLCAKPLIRPLRSAPGCAARGTRLTLTLDEDAFTGGSAFLFAEVLDVFFGLYAGINTFTQLVLKTVAFRRLAGECDS